MTFNVSGNVILDMIQCFHCDRKIRFIITNEFERCTICGAIYEQIEIKIENKSISCIYNFKGFGCKYYHCENECPLAFMYCPEHCDNKYIEFAENTINSSQNRIKDEKEKIKLIEESKKTWLVTKFK